MSAPALAGRPALTIRGTPYPVLLPSLRDPRLHLGAVIITLQVLGQTAFGFNVSIAQILVAIGTCALLEIGIAFFRQRVLMWPASALLTGNGVAFILRVPGTQHGDWWSLHGAWIFAATAAVSLLSKHLIRVQGRHLFNPSNFGLVLCFLALGKARAEPLDFWWGPMSPWLALAVALIVVGGLTILSRLRLLFIAVGFWLTFAAGIAVLAASGHSMTARWHLGPITGWSFWWLLVTSPEILIFLFFMITDPVTIPRGRVARLVYAVGVGALATLLIAPQTTERATKIAVLAALALVCAARPLLERVLPAAGSPDDRPRTWALGLTGRGRAVTGIAALGAVAAFAGVLVLAGLPARPGAAAADLPTGTTLPPVTVAAAKGVSARIDSGTARRVAADVVADLQAQADALRLRDPERAAAGAAGAQLVALREQIGSAAGTTISVPSYRIARIDLTLTRGVGQGPPRVRAALTGTEQTVVYRGRPATLVRRLQAKPFQRTVALALDSGRYVIVGGEGSTAQAMTSAQPAPAVQASGPLAHVHLQDVASQVGLGFHQGAFRFGVSSEPTAMMGGGLCWLDYDGDGWLDLYVVNSYANADRSAWDAHGGLPRSALFHNVRGSFVNVTQGSGAGLAVQGDGCVAADFNGDGRTDLFVTTTDGDRLLWNDGNGRFSEGARAAGIDVGGWHSGAAVADVNGDGRPDLFVAGYTDLNEPVAGSIAGFPSNYEGVRDLLYLNEGPDGHGRSTFREVGVQAGLEASRFSHGLGALFTDYNGDGRPDLYVANDEDPNQLYENVAWPGGAAADPAGLGFRFEERAAAEGADDPYAGMGIASGDYSGDGRLDLFVTNSRREPYAVLRRSDARGGPAFRNGRAAFRSAAAGSAGWGAAWADLALTGTQDLVLANGDIPVTSLARDAGRIEVLARGSKGRFASVAVPGLAASPRVDGRGVAIADYDNNGTPDVAVNSVGGPLLLLRDTGATGHWLEVKLGPFVPGAVVTAVLPSGRRLVQEVHAGSSYLSSEDPRVHFGLGSATRVPTLLVRFPGGATARLSNVRADRVVAVQAPAPVAARGAPAAKTYLLAGCTPARQGSAARTWDEAALAVEHGAPPTTAARDLFHLSAAMWDAWDAYEPKGNGYFVSDKRTARDTLAAQDATLSYAAYRLLLWRASFGTDVRQSFALLTRTLRGLCYDPAFVDANGDSPAALGNRIAAAAIVYGRTDGSLEGRRYLDPTYTPVNQPQVVSQAGTPPHDATFWQPLALGQIVVQGGLPIPSRVQTFVGSQWGHVLGFALPRSRKGLPIDPGAPPLGDPSSRRYQDAALDVVRWSAHSEPAAVASWNGSQSAPLRWNGLANSLPSGDERGRTASQRLGTDVRLYFALNAALHDAAVATWGTKRAYQSVRPISMIRSLAFAGQSSDRHAPSFDPQGIPLVPGLVELVTRRSSAPGRPLARLAGHVGDVAVRTAHGWVLGTRWSPRGATPPSPGWVADGSAFGRAAASVLAAETGTERLPASLLPDTRTYAQAADDAGRSALYEGTQVPADVAAGSRLGSRVGKAAWTLVQRYFAGTAKR